MHFHNIHTFAYQKALHHTLLLLVFKIVESLQCILNKINEWGKGIKPRTHCRHLLVKSHPQNVINMWNM